MKRDSIAITVFCISMLPVMFIAGGNTQPMEQPEPIEIEEERPGK